MTIKFSVVGKDLLDKLNRLSRVVGKTENIDLLADNNRLVLRTINDMRSGVIVLPATVDRAGTFTIPRSTLEGVFRNKSLISVTISNSELSFKAPRGNYCGNSIPLVPATTDSIKFERLDVKPLKPEVQNRLLVQIAAAALQDPYDDSNIAVHVVATDTGLVVASADSLHAAISRCKLAKPLKLDPIIIPSEYAELLSNFSVEGLAIAVDQANILLSNDEMRVSLPSLQVGSIPFERIMQLDGQKEKATFSCSIDGSALNSLIQNVQVVHEAGAGTQLDYRDQKIFVSYSTSYGQVVDALEVTDVTGSGSINLETDTLSDLLGKIGGRVKLEFFGSAMARFTKKLAHNTTIKYYVTALDRDTQKKLKKKAAEKTDTRGDE